ncbi:MAG: hypothetical protein C0494_10585 [Sphingobium sp.]|nr:hypothetical protein [Sphingobium sp.]
MRAHIRFWVMSVLLVAALAFLPGGGSPAWAAPASRDAAFTTFDVAIEKTKSAMMGDPETALTLARHASRLAASLPRSNQAEVARATAGWLEGEALIGANRSDLALSVIENALSLAQSVAPDSKLHGDLLRSRGALAAGQGKVVEALKDYQDAYRAFVHAKVARSQAMALQDIGQIYWLAADNEKALAYYQKAIETYGDDPIIRLTTHNNRAEVYRKLGRYDLTSKEYNAALVEAQLLKSPLLQARILANYADALTQAGNLKAAQRAAERAIALVQTGEGVGWRAVAYGSAGKAAAGREDWAQAKRYFDLAFAGIDLTKSDMSYHDYHGAAADVYEKVGDRDLALAHLRAFQRLDAEAAKLTASYANQLASAQFDFAAQNLKISDLRKKQLERDVAMERQRAQFRMAMFIGLGSAGLVAFAVTLAGFFSVRRSRDEVRAANDNLQNSNTKLEKALQAKTEFLAMTSHEIRTPLNGILGMTQVLLTDRGIASDVRGRIEVVNSAGLTMKALVDDILDVAKMESGKLAIVHDTTNLQQILKEAGQLWSGQAQSKSIGLRLQTDDAPAIIVGDGARIRQIIFNLMSNALKFTHEGEVSLQVMAETAADEGEQLVIRVRDSGIGIGEDMQAAIFEPFRQVDSAMNRQYSGTGLGLSICRQLVAAMAGTIAVDSILGEGATFTVKLPLRFPEGTAASQDAGPDHALGDRSVLAFLPFDDELVMLKMLLAAHCGRVDILESAPPSDMPLPVGDYDLIIIDPVCLSADDANALQHWIEAADAAGAKTSLLLADSGPVTPAAAMMMGADQIILRPVEAEDIVEALCGLFGAAPENFVAPSLTALSA